MTKKHSTKKALVASILALCMCFTMLIGTTFAWFTDSVTSSGNIIQTGELKVGFQWADGKEDPTTVTWTDVDGALFDYDNWEPGYAVAKHIKVSNKGTLALNYQMRIVADGVVTKLADAIDVYVIAGADVKALTRADLDAVEPIGTLTEVLGTTKNLSKTIKGSIKASEEADVYTLVLKMNENAGNEYQSMDLGCTFSVELLATQMSYESDSLDNTYDDLTNVPNEAVPAALVRALDDLNISYTLGIGGSEQEGTLDAGYQFEPTISYDDAQKSLYRYWHADFVVKADKDVPADSIALAGYYDAWCSLNNYNWVALVNDGEDIAANTEIRLVENLGAVNWEEICNYGNDGLGFQCGAIDLTGENMGTTITVELRIYETTKAWDAESGTANDETGNYITVGSFNYTFGINTAEKLEYALTNSGEYALSADLELDEAFTVPSGVETVIDLNGYTITGTDNATTSFGLITNRGTLTIKDSVGGGAITLKANNDRDWNAYSSVISNTVGGKFTLESGTIEHLGGSDMAYGIDNLTNGKGTYAETVINGGTVVSPYRAIRMFLNGIEAQNILTVNGGEIKGDNKSIWMQDPSANANTGTLTVTEGASLYGDVNLTVTAGSTSWPVTVSVNANALKGGAEVLNSNVPEGYEVILVDGCYVVVAN